jgi:serine/threonine protein kinase
MLKQEEYNKFMTDWWSLGIMIYELLVGIKPFEGETVE